MRNLSVQSLRKIKKAIPRIENAIKVKININKEKISITGNELNEYLTEQIIHAIDFGFEVEDALLLLRNGFVLEFIEIKEHTRRKNLKDVRSRIIGREGKAKKTIEKLTGAAIVINENDIGVIVDSDHLTATVQAIESLISGSKHGNIFGFLERQGSKITKRDEDLGLKEDL